MSALKHFKNLPTQKEAPLEATEQDFKTKKITQKEAHAKAVGDFRHGEHRVIAGFNGNLKGGCYLVKNKKGTEYGIIWVFFIPEDPRPHVFIWWNGLDDSWFLPAVTHLVAKATGRMEFSFPGLSLDSPFTAPAVLKKGRTTPKKKQISRRAGWGEGGATCKKTRLVGWGASNIQS